MKLEKRNTIIGIVFLLLLSVVAFYFYIFKYDGNNQDEGRIEVYGIEPGQKITSPLLIKGRVTGGNWIGFEGQVGTVKLIGSNGEILGSSVLTVASDWMKLPIDFEANLSFKNPQDKNVSLVFYNENPSGLPENNETMSISLEAGKETVIVNVYFGKSGNDDTCTKVFSLEREIEKTEAVARAAIEELIKGPTAEEKQAGYFTGIKSNTKINKLTIVDGTAKVDFDEALEEGVGGSCMVSEIRQQIIQTLMQFETVKKVIISINGRTEDILQP
jgi:hypothetical protein